MTGPDTYTFEDDGAGFPNSRLPMLVYHGVDEARDADTCLALFDRNGWRGGWIDGIFPFHHFHSNAHEVLGIVGGSAAVILGGPQGRRFEIGVGDVLVLPPGTGHCNVGSSADLVVVGAYPDGMAYDLRRGHVAERDDVVANIAKVPLPARDPVSGKEQPFTPL